MSTANIYSSCGYSVLLIPKEDSTQDFLILAVPEPLGRFRKIMEMASGNIATMKCPGVPNLTFSKIT